MPEAALGKATMSGSDDEDLAFDKVDGCPGRHLDTTLKKECVLVFLGNMSLDLLISLLVPALPGPVANDVSVLAPVRVARRWRAIVACFRA